MVKKISASSVKKSVAKPASKRVGSSAGVVKKTDAGTINVSKITRTGSCSGAGNHKPENIKKK